MFKLYWYFAIPLKLLLPLISNVTAVLLFPPLSILASIVGAVGIPLSKQKLAVFTNAIFPCKSLAYTHKYQLSPLTPSIDILLPFVNVFESGKNVSSVKTCTLWVHLYLNVLSSTPRSSVTVTLVVCSFAHVSLPFGSKVIVGGVESIIKLIIVVWSNSSVALIVYSPSSVISSPSS